MAKSVAKVRQINCYPSPALKKKLEDYAADKVISKSEVINEALRQFFGIQQKANTLNNKG